MFGEIAEVTGNISYKTQGYSSRLELFRPPWAPHFLSEKHLGWTDSRTGQLSSFPPSSASFQIAILSLLFVLSRENPVCENAFRYLPEFPGSEKVKRKTICF